MIKNIFFDLDGTLLDTIGDIANAVNDTMEELGLPYRYDKNSTRRLIGNGVPTLMRRALQEDASEEMLARFEPLYMPRYRSYQGETCAPFEGMPEVLQTLKERGYRLFIASNKPDELTKAIIAKMFGDGLFIEASGHRKEDPVKPNPIQVDRLIEKYGLKREECIYIGDSIVDMETAENAHMPALLCLWGYGHYGEGWEEKAAMQLHKPSDILDFLGE